MKTYNYDAFISFADEDKAFTANLVELLEQKGLKIWFSGTELRRKPSDLLDDINQGIAQSKYGIAVISPHYIRKKWTKTELGVLFAREPENEKTLIPLWHKITYDELRQTLPIICDRFAFETKEGIEPTAEKVYQIIRRQEKMEQKPPLKSIKNQFWQCQKYRLLTFITISLLLLNSRIKTILWSVLLTISAIVLYRLADSYEGHSDNESQVIQELKNTSAEWIKLQILDTLRDVKKETKIKEKESFKKDIFTDNQVDVKTKYKKDSICENSNLGVVFLEKIDSTSFKSNLEDSAEKVIEEKPKEMKNLSKIYKVYMSTKDIKNSEICIKKGQKVQITASGDVLLSDISSKISPDGISVGLEYNYRKLITPFPLGKLICWIEGSRHWYPCGKQYEFIAQKSGLLIFRINDTQFGASSGNTDIKVIVSDIQEN